MTSKELEVIETFFSEFSSRNEFFEDDKVLRFCNIQNITDKDLDLIKRIQPILDDSACIFLNGEIDQNFDIPTVTINQLESQEISLIVQKKTSSEQLMYFSLSAFRKALQNNVFLNNEILIFKRIDPFATCSIKVSDPVNKSVKCPEWNGIKNCKQIVKDLTSESTVITDISQWLLLEQYASSNNIFRTFLIESAKRLFCVLASEVMTVDNKTTLEFISEKKYLIKFDSIDITDETNNESLYSVHKAVDWIYGTESTCETRHTLFNYQIALDIAYDNRVSCSKIDVALSNAKNAYSFFLRSQSREVLRSLSELKKNVSLELAEHNRNTYNIIKNLWRDLMFAAISIAFDIFAGKNNLEISIIIPIFVASGISISFIVATYSEIKYQRIASKNMNTWYPQLYSFLTETDMKILVDNPIRSIKNNLYLIIGICFFIYLVVDCIILRNEIAFLTFMRF